MTSEAFRALLARKTESGQAIALEQITEADLPAGDVTVDVEYSSFNYKDGLALKGLGRILRTFPMVPGIDFAGTVRASDNAGFKAGDKVVLTGWGVGESWSGGFAERARVKGEWLVKLPVGLSTRQAMAIGTAGLTAMLCADALERYGITPGGDVLVTGAAGGVGSVAVRVLSRLGYKVSALTGRRGEADFLTGLGASAIVDRADYASPGKPLAGERWAGAVDTAGGAILANVLAATAYGGAVAACGLAASSELATTVFPFILRNVALLGVDSVNCPTARRLAAWERLATLLTEADFALVTHEVELEALPALAGDILAGHVRGRTIVAVRPHG
ncbi:MDR family oxidoreductase [Xanthobacter agilis]|jgi:acrylyl-CoA reductase (NADPH)|uniref:Acrylyl-CoA reductase (NADPH) n=1 Tax=Xanthobacter agilis TaxID=47492 RepID=A0ABU0LCY8_XANAG|nr:MDR family oxidoreductase [Xanthobacter agilis]MDQ0504991.1 acrylyl-CoA reductase (NADPH) [Xanthobacter agilis]